MEGGVRWVQGQDSGWKLRCSIRVGLPCGGSGLVLSCKLETTCEGCGAAEDGWQEGGSHPTPRMWLQKPGKVPLPLWWGLMLACSSHSDSRDPAT